LKGVFRHSLSDTLSNIRCLIGWNLYGCHTWIWIPHKVVRPTCVSSNRTMIVRESARKRVFLAFLLIEWRVSAESTIHNHERHQSKLF